MRTGTRIGYAPAPRSFLRAAAGSGCDGPAAEEEAPADPDESTDRSEFAAAGEDAIPSARGAADWAACGPAAAADWLGKAADGGVGAVLGATPSLRPACGGRRLAVRLTLLRKSRALAVIGSAGPSDA